MAKQTDTTWRPTKAQAHLLETAAQAGLNRTIVKVCKEADVSRATFYRWLEHDDFRKAWEDSWYGATRRHMPGVVAAQIARALDGDTQAATFVARMAGLWIDKKEITLPKDPQSMSDEELEEFARALGVRD